MNASETNDFDIEGKKHKQIFDFILSCFTEDNSPRFIAEYNEVLNYVIVSLNDEPFFIIDVKYVGKFYNSRNKVTIKPYAPKNMNTLSVTFKNFDDESRLEIITLISEIKQESVLYDIRRPTLSTENKIFSIVLEELRKNKSVSAYEYDDIQDVILVYVDNKICYSISLSWNGVLPSERKYFLYMKPYFSDKAHKITKLLSKNYSYMGYEINNQTHEIVSRFINLQVEDVIFLLDKANKDKKLTDSLINNYIKDIDGIKYDFNDTVLYKGEQLNIKIENNKVYTYVSFGNSNIMDDDPNLIELKDAIYIIDKLNKGVNHD